MATLTLLSMARCRTDDIHHTAQLLWTDCIVGKTNGAHRDDVGDVVAFKAQDVGCRVHVSNQETGLHLITVKMIRWIVIERPGQVCSLKRVWEAGQECPHWSA